MKPIAKIGIGTGFLTIIGFGLLRKYLKNHTAKTSNYLKGENTDTFFVNVELLPLLEKVPFIKFNIETIYLIVDDIPVAKSINKLSVPAPATLINSAHEFTPISIADFDAIKSENPKNEIEVVYNTFHGIKMKQRYPLTLDQAETVQEQTDNNCCGCHTI